MADEDFAPGDEPLHIRGFDIMRVEQVAASPYYGRGAVAETTELLAFELRGVFQPAFAVINIALARATLEENRDRQQLQPFLDGAQQACRRDLADVPLAVKIFVVALA